MESIHSQQNPRIKKLVRLHSSRGRQKQNRIAIFGSREILRAIRSGVEPEELFICEQLANPQTVSNIQSEFSDFDSVAISVTAELFEKICFGDRADGIVMSATRPELSLEKVFQHSLSLEKVLQHSDSQTPIIAVVESIEKPGNLGAILRSADGAGLDGLVVADPLTDWFHPNTIRSSLGTCFSVPGSVSDVDSLQQRLVAEGFQVIVASLQGAADFYEFDLTQKLSLIHI